MPPPPLFKRCPACGAETTADGTCPACMLDHGWLQDKKETATDCGVPLPDSFGDYEILTEIARGGMGVVFKARQRSLNRIVALKMILAGKLAGHSELQRFRTEAETAAALQHPNIVAIHEVGEFEGQPFFSMDYVEGKSLAQLAHNEPLPAKRAAAYLKTIAEAVAYAHSKGVLHRDLKPSNILIDQNDQPRITDFGLAKRLDDELSTLNPQLTLTGQVLGSPNFMPPEQAIGDSKAVGPASDVYSLGAILYQLLTGRPPFLAETLTQTLRMVAESEPVGPRLLAPSVPVDLETICLKCLEKDRHRRYGTAREVAEELNRFLNHEPIRARPISPAEKLTRWVRRHPAIAGLGALAGISLVAVAAISTISAARLHRANQEGQEKLRESLLQQARANRWSGRPGRRFDSLEALRKAAEIRPGLDLRNEAIAAMALIDIRSVKHWSLDIPRAEYQIFDSRLDRYVRTYTNGALSLHRTSDDRELRTWPANGFTPHPAGAAFSSDGRFLATAWIDKEVQSFKVFDLRDGLPVFSQVGRFRTFRFSRDSRKLAVVRAPKPFTINIYDTEDWHQITSFTTQSLPYAVEFDPAGDGLAIGSTESWKVQIRNTRSGELMQTLNHSNYIHGLAWSPNGNVIAAGCEDRSIYLWDLSQSPPQPTRLQCDATVFHLSFNRQGDKLVSGDWHTWSKIWHVPTGKELLHWPAGNGSTFSSDENSIVSHISGKRSDLFDFSSAEECQRLHFKGPAGGTYQLVYDPNGLFLISTHKDGLRFWDTQSSAQIAFIAKADIRSLEFARDGHGFIPSASASSELYWWPIVRRQSNSVNSIIIGPPQVVTHALAASQQANRLLAFAASKAYLIDDQAFRIQRHLASVDGAYWTALSPDGHQCATWAPGAQEQVVQVFDADDDHLLATLNAPNGSSCLLFSPDGHWLLTGSPDEYIFWERSSWKPIHRIDRGMTGGTRGKADFSPDGRQIALFVERTEIEVLDAITFEPLAIFEAPEDANAVSDVTFSPDGSQLAVATQGQEIWIWDLPLVRKQLASMNLDWEAPALPAREASHDLVLATEQKFNPINRLSDSSHPARDPLCGSNQIDLTRFYNACLSSSWFNPIWKNNDLAALPSGLQTLEGIGFDIRGIVQLASTHPDLAFNYPAAVTNIPVRQKCHFLHFLHSTGWSHVAGAEIGEYIIRYEDGAEQSVPLIYQENTLSWWEVPGHTAKLKPDTTVAWRGRNRMSDKAGTDLLLFHFRWENPRPEVAISSLTLRSRMTPCAPFLVAITAE